MLDTILWGPRSTGIYDPNAPINDDLEPYASNAHDIFTQGVSVCLSVRLSVCVSHDIFTQGNPPRLCPPGDEVARIVYVCAFVCVCVCVCVSV